MRVRTSIGAASATALMATWAGTGAAQTLPSIKIASVGNPVTFATHAELDRYGFAWGPSDGQFGAIPIGDGRYRFYGAAGSTSSCAGSPNVSNSAFTFTGTLDRVSGGDGCRKLFGPGGGPVGWVFDKDYGEAGRSCASRSAASAGG